MPTKRKKPLSAADKAIIAYDIVKEIPSKEYIPLQEAVPFTPETPVRDLFQIAGLVLLAAILIGGMTYMTHKVNMQSEYDSNK